MIKLHPHQITLKNDIYSSWNANNRNVIAVLPTGGGKSVIVSDITYDGFKSNMRQAIIAHRNELVTQMSSHIAQRGIPHRIIGSDSTVRQAIDKHYKQFGRSFIHPSAPTAVVGVDTLMSRKDDLVSWAKQIDRWTVDESHHVIKTNKWGQAVEMFSNAHGLGVTATPIRADGQGLGRHADGVFDAMVQGPSMRWLIENGFLADYDIVCPKSDLYVDDKIVSKNGDWSNQTLRKAAKKSHIVGDVVENYVKHASGRKAIVFATDVETAGEIAKEFNEAGIRAASLSAESLSTVREKYLSEFSDGRLKVLINVDLFDEGFDCLDLQTEVLTPNGWKNYADMKSEKTCYAWNSDTGEAEIVSVQKYGIRLLRDGEKLLEIKSQHTDIRVTENHRIYSKDVNYYKYNSGLSDDVKICTAGEIYSNSRNKFALPISSEKTFKGLPLCDDEIRILGWYMTDGYMTKNNALEIYQSKKHQIKKIRDMLGRLGWYYTERERIIKSSYTTIGKLTCFYVPKKQLEHLLPYMDKKNPPSTLNDLSKEQFKILWDTMMDGNGSKQGNKAGVCVTRYKGQVDFITSAAVVRGYATMYGTYQSKNNVKMYNMRIRDEKWMRFYQKDKRGAKFKFYIPKQKERVWCITNRLGTLITRRNGKVIILGNCPSCDVVILARPTASLGKYRQMIGRALRYMDGKVARIIDHVSNVIRHKLPDQHIAWSLNRRDKRAKQLKDPDDIELTVCTACSKPYEKFRTACPYCNHQKPLPEPRSRSIEMVEGDLILLDRATLEKMRGKTLLEAPGDVANRVAAVAGVIAGKGAANRQMAKFEAHRDLRESIAQWAAVERARGFNDSEIQRKFYLTTGVDILSALDASKPASEMTEMVERVKGWYL